MTPTRGFFLGALTSALSLIAGWDPELMAVVSVSLEVSVLSTLIAAVAGIPAGFALATRRFPGKRMVVMILNSLLALPTVVIGLSVYSLVSRRGILGDWGLLYTQSAIVIGQILLILPIVTALTLSAIGRVDRHYRRAALTLGATRFQASLAVAREARFAIASALITAFGRVISEIGVSMMLGGNVRGFTRTMTTAMALEYDKGEFVLAVALGIVLMVIGLGVNLILGLVQGGMPE